MLLSAIRYGAIDYLLKPLDENELKEALQRVIGAQPLLQEQIAITLHSFRKNKPQDHIALRSQQLVQIVALKEIKYLQGIAAILMFSDMAERRCSPPKPLRITRNYWPAPPSCAPTSPILSIEFYIDSYHSKEGMLYLKDGTQIPVSFRKKEMMDRYFKTL